MSFVTILNTVIVLSFLKYFNSGSVKILPINITLFNILDLKFMIPSILILGKFNIGKSLFFNKINYFFNNFSLNYNSLTLNNRKFFNILKNFNYLIIDSIGFNFFNNFNFNLKFYIFDCDIIIFFFDNIYGIFYEDKIISLFLKKNKKYVFLFINKIDILNFYINIFYFFKLGFGKPLIVNSSNNFNLIYSIDYILNVFCFLKNCFYFKYKINKFKIFIINFNFFENYKFINMFFKNKSTFFFDKESFIINFKLKNIIYSILNFNLYNFNFLLKKSIIFLKFFKTILISDLIFFFINPFTIYKNLFLFNFIIKYYKVLIFFIFSNNLNVISKLYFKNFFIKKFYLNFFYLFFLQFKNNFYYINYYINKIFNFKLNINSNNSFKFCLYFNNFLAFHKKSNKIKVFDLFQKVNIPFLIIIRVVNLKKLDSKYIILIKKKIIMFFKIKSFFLKIKFLF